MTKSEIRALVEESCLYVNSKCPDRDVDVTMLLDTLHRKMVEGRIEELERLHNVGYIGEDSIELLNGVLKRRIASLRRELEPEA